MIRRLLVLFAVVLAGLPACRRAPKAIAIGYEVNLASAPALLAAARGDFQTGLALPVRFVAHNAGPGVADALFTGKADFGYMDPVSAIGAFVRSKGKFVIIAGSALGGGALVVSRDVARTGINGLRDARVATPQVGSGADVSARHFFVEKGFVSREQGGEFQIVPIANLDLIRVFMRQDVAGAWTSEPWVSALAQEAGAVIIMGEGDPETQAFEDFPSSVVVARLDLVRRHPDLLAAFLKTHAALVDDINDNRADSRTACVRQLAEVAGRPFGDAALEQAWTHLFFSTEMPAAAVIKKAYEAYRVGFLGAAMPDLRPAFYEGAAEKAPEAPAGR